MRTVNQLKALNDVYDGREHFQSRVRYLETFPERSRPSFKPKKKPPVAGGFMTTSVA
jgi:hypothetical protein